MIKQKVDRREGGINLNISLCLNGGGGQGQDGLCEVLYTTIKYAFMADMRLGMRRIFIQAQLWLNFDLDAGDLPAGLAPGVVGHHGLRLVATVPHLVVDRVAGVRPVHGAIGLVHTVVANPSLGVLGLLA